jgi:hypothetical protein
MIQLGIFPKYIGFSLMVSSGIHIGWGLVLPSVLTEQWTFGNSKEMIYLVFVSWFITAIVGFTAAPYIYGKIPTKYIYVRWKLMTNACILLTVFLFLLSVDLKYISFDKWHSPRDSWII